MAVLYDSKKKAGVKKYLIFVVLSMMTVMHTSKYCIFGGGLLQLQQPKPVARTVV